MSTLAVDGMGAVVETKALQQSGCLEADVGIWSPALLRSVGSDKVMGSTSSQLIGAGWGGVRSGSLIHYTSCMHIQW